MKGNRLTMKLMLVIPLLSMMTQGVGADGQDQSCYNQDPPVYPGDKHGSQDGAKRKTTQISTGNSSHLFLGETQHPNPGSTEHGNTDHYGITHQCHEQCDRN